MLEASSRGPQAFPPAAPPSPLAIAPPPAKPYLRQLLKHQNCLVPTVRPRPAVLPVLQVQSSALRARGLSLQSLITMLADIEVCFSYGLACTSLRSRTYFVQPCLVMG